MIGDGGIPCPPVYISSTEQNIRPPPWIKSLSDLVTTFCLPLSCCCCSLSCHHWCNLTRLLKKFWPLGNRLRSTHYREFLYMKLCRPALTSLELLNYYLTLAMSSLHIMSFIVMTPSTTVFFICWVACREFIPRWLVLFAWLVEFMIYPLNSELRKVNI